MELLKAIEGIRTPFFDTVFSLITHLGEETVFLALGLLFFWCISKKEGYFLIVTGIAGTVINQFLKLIFRVPRPWVKDPEFTIVESARAEATGYSFPSGHTQTSVGVFGGIARWNRNTLLRIISIVLCVLVPFSRLYLGVHSPLDVGVSVGIALILVFALCPVMRTDKGTRWVLIGMLALSIAFMVYVIAAPYKYISSIDPDNLASGVKKAYSMLGCSAGLLLSFEIERKWIEFDTKAKWWAQIIKLLVGFGILLAIKILLKPVLNSIFGGYTGDAVRYFLMTVFAGLIWPLTFRWFSKLGSKKKV